MMAFKGSLSATDLANYDDIATDVLIDNALGIMTHKMESNYTRIPVDNLQLESIMMEMACTKDLKKAFARLFGPDGLVSVALEKSPKAKQVQEILKADNFKVHALGYIGMFLPNTGFAVVCDKRYTKDGARVMSTRLWKKDEEIQDLVGCIAEISTAEETTLLRQGVNDFSVMFSNIRHKSQLWLGPAAYINHDCNPTCEFQSAGSSSATVKVLREFGPHEEITCYYGSNFFGPQNRDCGCSTCEKNGSGIFNTPDGPTFSPVEQLLQRQALKEYERHQSTQVNAVDVLEIPLRQREVVFVNPDDSNEASWWPALIVPGDEIDDHMPIDIAAGELIVRYFEDFKFSKTLASDLVAFHVDLEPYTSFVRSKGTRFLMHPGVVRARKYCLSGDVPEGMKWKNWRTTSQPQRFLTLNKELRSPSDSLENSVAIVTSSDSYDPILVQILKSKTADGDKKKKGVEEIFQIKNLLNFSKASNRCPLPITGLDRAGRRFKRRKFGLTENIPANHIRIILRAQVEPQVEESD